MKKSIIKTDAPIEGSTRWVKKQLENAELQLLTLEDGSPAIAIEWGDDPKVAQVVAFIGIPRRHERGDYFRWENVEVNYYVTYPVEADREHGLFRILTPDAERYVGSFIRQCLDKLVDYYEAGDCPANLELTLTIP